MSYQASDIARIESLARQPGLRLYHDLNGTTKNLEGTNHSFGNPTVILPIVDLEHFKHDTFVLFKSNSTINGSTNNFLVIVYNPHDDPITYTHQKVTLQGDIRPNRVYGLMRAYDSVFKIVNLHESILSAHVDTLNDTQSDLLDAFDFNVAPNKVAVKKEIIESDKNVSEEVHTKKVFIDGEELKHIKPDDFNDLFEVQFLHHFNKRIIRDPRTPEEYESDTGTPLSNGVIYLQITEQNE